MELSNRNKSLFRYTALAAASLLSAPVWSAGFELPQYGVREMGVAKGGSAALLEDASAVANNPAGLIRLQGRNFTGGAALVLSEFDYDIEVRRELRAEVGGTVPGQEKGSINGAAVVPHLYYSTRLADNAAVGIGLYVPVGSATSYKSDWAGRYHATDTEITAINIAPTFAWKVTPTVSAGIGAVIQRFEGNFKNKIDLGYILGHEMLNEVAEQNQAILENSQNPAAGLAIKTQVIDRLAHNYDVDNEMHVTSTAFGINAGLLWEPTPRFRAGLQYNSEIRHRPEGTATRTQLNDPNFRQSIIDAICDSLSGLGGSGDIYLLDCYGTSQSSQEDRETAEDGADTALGPLGAQGGKIDTDIIVPHRVTASFVYGLTDHWLMTGGVTWTNWSRVKEIRFSYPDNSQRGGSPITDTDDDVRRRDLVQDFSWQDTFRYGLGAIYDNQNRWAFRFGAAYDESPMPDSSRRSPRGPDSDRIIGSLGMSYRWSDSLVIDAAYSYTHFTDSEINARENPAGTDHRMVGDIKGQLHTAAMQVSYSF
ncbi:MAG: outer membrane protein transport protein [Marinobacter sp.]|nr:outer membrane protein transport protein [Marinobacter sp.]